eukprot:m.1131259 g.1131259  ORF g.1131259 m.1131259 type:complete len:534 (+) comp24424_c3_seq27:123-1724(+)
MTDSDRPVSTRPNKKRRSIGEHTSVGAPGARGYDFNPPNSFESSDGGSQLGNSDSIASMDVSRSSSLRSNSGSSSHIRRGSHYKVDVSVARMASNTTVHQEDTIDLDRLIGYVKLSNETLLKIFELFNVLDTDGSGSIEQVDFQTDSFVANADNFVKWKQVQDYFAKLSIPQITLSDFIKGFKTQLWESTKTKTWNPSAEALGAQPLKAWLDKIGQHFDSNLARDVFEWHKWRSSVHKPTTRTAERRFMLDEEEVQVMCSIELSDEALFAVRTLWSSFSKLREDEGITHDDISRSLGSDAGEKWNLLAEYFDKDGDGVISAEEFLNGFKQHSLASTMLSAPADTSLSLNQWMMHIGSQANEAIVRLCNDIAPFTGAEGQLKITQAVAAAQASKQVTQPGPQQAPSGAVAPQDWVAGVALEPNALSYIAQLYALLDRNGDGVLTVADFTMDGFSLQKNNAWVKVQQFFDSDKDGAVTQADFRHGFIKYAVQSPDLFFLSAQGVTFTQCLAAAQSFVNDKIVQLCKEFYAVLTPP